MVETTLSGRGAEFDLVSVACAPVGRPYPFSFSLFIFAKRKTWSSWANTSLDRGWN
jgi:hypothetical protein